MSEIQKTHTQIWLMMIEYWGAKKSNETVKMYAHHTHSSGFTPDDIEKVFHVWALDSSKCSNFPLPGDLIGILRGTGSSRSAADQIANDVLTAMKSYSSAYGFSCPTKLTFSTMQGYVHATFGEQTFKVIERWGGPGSLSMELNSTSAISTVRAQLRDLAQSLIDAPHASQQISPTIALQGSQSGKAALSGSQNVTSLIKKVVKNTSL